MPQYMQPSSNEAMPAPSMESGKEDLSADKYKLILLSAHEDKRPLSPLDWKSLEEEAEVTGMSSENMALYCIMTSNKCNLCISVKCFNESYTLLSSICDINSIFKF